MITHEKDLKKIIDEIIYNVENIDEEGFSNYKIIEKIKELCERVKGELNGKI